MCGYSLLGPIPQGTFFSWVIHSSKSSRSRLVMVIKISNPFPIICPLFASGLYCIISLAVRQFFSVFLLLRQYLMLWWPPPTPATKLLLVASQVWFYYWHESYYNVNIWSTTSWKVNSESLTIVYHAHVEDVLTGSQGRDTFKHSSFGLEVVATAEKILLTANQ